MRILFLTPLYLPHVGGLEILVDQLGHELGRRGHELAIVTSHGDEADAGLADVDGISVLRVDAHRVVGARDAAGILRVQIEIARFARTFKADVVHSHDAGPVLWMYHRSARGSGPPIIVTLHNVMTRILGPSLPVLARMLHDAAWTTAVSQAVLDDALTYAPYVVRCASVVENGIDPPPSDAALQDGPPHLVCIGRLEEEKGFDIAIRAFAAVLAARPDARLVVVGDGSQRGPLTALAAELGVTHAVDFLGMVDRAGVARALVNAAAVLIPSRFEGLPLVALEAAWAERPVVAAQSPGLSEAVVDGETALVVPVDDPSALAAAALDLLAHPARGQTLGRAARARAQQRYSLGRCTDAYERVYQQVVTADAGSVATR